MFGPRSFPVDFWLEIAKQMHMDDFFGEIIAVFFGQKFNVSTWKRGVVVAVLWSLNQGVWRSAKCGGPWIIKFVKRMVLKYG